MTRHSYFQFIPWPNDVVREHGRRFSRDPLPVLSAEGRCEKFWHGQGCSLFDVVHPAFPLPTKASQPSKVPWRMVLESLSWRVTCPNLVNYRLLTVGRRGSCGPMKKLILSAPSRWSCAPSRGCGEVSSGTWFRTPGSFFVRVSKQGPYFTAIEENGGDKGLVLLQDETQGCSKLSDSISRIYL